MVLKAWNKCNRSSYYMKLKEILEKENKRVTYEWDALMKKYGTNYDAMTQDGKDACCALAEKQGERSHNMWKAIERL